MTGLESTPPAVGDIVEGGTEGGKTTTRTQGPNEVLGRMTESKRGSGARRLGRRTEETRESEGSATPKDRDPTAHGKSGQKELKVTT